MDKDKLIVTGVGFIAAQALLAGCSPDDASRIASQNCENNVNGCPSLPEMPGLGDAVKAAPGGEYFVRPDYFDNAQELQRLINELEQTGWWIRYFDPASREESELPVLLADSGQVDELALATAARDGGLEVTLVIGSDDTLQDYEMCQRTGFCLSVSRIQSNPEYNTETYPLGPRDPEQVGLVVSIVQDVQNLDPALTVDRAIFVAPFFDEDLPTIEDAAKRVAAGGDFLVIADASFGPDSRGVVEAQIAMEKGGLVVDKYYLTAQDLTTNFLPGLRTSDFLPPEGQRSVLLYGFRLLPEEN